LNFVSRFNFIYTILAILQQNFYEVRWACVKLITRRKIEMINNVILVGRLTKDPDLRYTADGQAVCNVTLAVGRNFKKSDGVVETDFINCTLWRKTAENTANYCKKGSVIGVTGRIQTRHYENETGQRIYVTDVLAESVKFLSSKPQPRELVEN
jgi:single-strand DNA-binding protein